MKKEKRIEIRVDSESFDIFKNICKDNNKSVSDVLRDYINKIIEKHNRK